MNVQVASGCIKKWYETIEGVSRCNSEVILPQWVAAMPLPVGDETRTSKSCIRTAVAARGPLLRLASGLGKPARGPRAVT